MARLNTQALRWGSVRGLNLRNTPQSLPDDFATDLLNVELMEGALGRPRPSGNNVTLTSGPSARVRYLTEHVYNSAAELWAFSGATNITAHRRASGTWTSVTLTDTPAGLGIHAASFNNKLFVAYNSSENRLHVIEDGTCRRGGLGKPAALTVADTGAGAYAATARRYRTAQRIKSGSTVLATSELSDAVSFTPSGGGAAARITKSATEDSATHWVVYGLIATLGDTYDLYEELSEMAVGTTTYDDSTDPASYDGDAPMQLGMNIPPPSCKYLLATDSRILMAGVYESSGASDETAPLDSRVYFTRVLGTSDQGDDESIPNTTDQKNWIDVGRNDGDTITALAGPVDGIIYVFKKRSIWRLIPTGIDTAPYRAERVTNAVGAQNGDPAHTGCFNQYSTVMAEDDYGQPVIYFVSLAGAYRISAAGGIEYVGWDVTDPQTGRAFPSGSSVNGSVVAGAYIGSRRQIWWLGDDDAEAWILTPRLMARTEQGWRGGWSKYSFENVLTETADAIVYSGAAGSSLAPVIGGAASASAAKILEFSGTTTADDSQSFPITLTSKPFLLGEGGVLRFSLQHPILEGAVSNSAPTVQFTGNYGLTTRSATAALAASGSETRRSVTVEGLEDADLHAVQCLVTWGANQNTTIDALTLRYRLQEAL